MDTQPRVALRRRRRATKTKWALGGTSAVATFGLMAQMGPLTAAGAEAQAEAQAAAADAGTGATTPAPTGTPTPTATPSPLPTSAAPALPQGAPSGLAMNIDDVQALGLSATALPTRPVRSGAGGVYEPAWAASLTTTTTTAAPRPRPAPTVAPAPTAPPATTPPATTPPPTSAPPPPPPPPPTSESSG